MVKQNGSKSNLAGTLPNIVTSKDAHKKLMRTERSGVRVHFLWNSTGSAGRASSASPLDANDVIPLYLSRCEFEACVSQRSTFAFLRTLQCIEYQRVMNAQQAALRYCARGYCQRGIHPFMFISPFDEKKSHSKKNLEVSLPLIIFAPEMLIDTLASPGLGSISEK